MPASFASAKPRAKNKRKLDAAPDRVDPRDLMYQPRLAPLPDRIVNCDEVLEILDQGQEGACTGFALAAVVNFHLQRRNLRYRASPRMLYEMARRYDEWPGANYEGSSARGAMKGWVAHGVCRDVTWPADQHGAKHLTDEVAKEAQRIPGGAYYRVMHRRVRDMHAALTESGILYCTLMVHDGWMEPSGTPERINYADHGNARERVLPVIERKGRADGGHAVAIVGYTERGFIILNSWGPGWGADGFALLPYEDYLLHATDVWVAQLGVPILTDLWTAEQAGGSQTAGLHRAAEEVPLAAIRPFVVDVGNNGKLSDGGKYWTTEDDVQRLFQETIPQKTQAWSRKRVLIYLHGGLNSEEAVARRIVAFRDVLMQNEIYPLHIMWETGWAETLGQVVEDLFTDDDERAGGWFDRMREGLSEAKDWSFEQTVSKLGTTMWDEMKENAELASTKAEGAMKLVARHALKSLEALSAAERNGWEVHVVGHSAGSIFAAHLLELMIEIGVRVKTLQFFAPAIRRDTFESIVAPLVKSGKCPQPSLFVLDDATERADTVWRYGKSLLYLVSNAFEGRRYTPLLGMQRFLMSVSGSTADDLKNTTVPKLFERQVDGRQSLIIAGQPGDEASLSTSTTHGGFDNDAATLNSMLWRVLGAKPARLFDQVRDLSFG